MRLGRLGLLLLAAQAATGLTPSVPPGVRVPVLRPGPPGSVRESARVLLDVVRDEGSYTDEETRRVWDAFVLAMRLHRKQVRSSGEPYVTHPLEVATILASCDSSASCE